MSGLTSATLIIQDLPPETTQDSLENIFSQVYHLIENISIIRDKFTGVSKGFAFIQFRDKNDSIAWMKNMGNNLLKLNDSVLRVNYSYSTNGKKAQWNCAIVTSKV